MSKSESLIFIGMDVHQDTVTLPSQPISRVPPPALSPAPALLPHVELAWEHRPMNTR